MFKPQRLMLALGGAGAAGLSVLALRRARRALAHASPVTGTVTINRSPREVYALLRDLESLPELMTYVSSVRATGDVSVWTATLPLIGEVTWRGRLTEDVPGVRLVWETDGKARTKIRARIELTKAPSRESTEVRLEMQLGVLGADPSVAAARYLAGPAVKANLRRLKQVLETGEVLRSDASGHRMPHPAQPTPDVVPAPTYFIPHVRNVQKEKAS